MSRQEATSAKFINYYEVLRVRPFHSFEEIQIAFNTEIKKWHPDKHSHSTIEEKNLALHRTKLILEARSILSDPLKKSSYDADFERLFPRRFLKLSTQTSSPKQVSGKKKKGQKVGDDLIRVKKIYWYDFSSRINRKTKKVSFNLLHFFEHNPGYEARMRFNINSPWTDFSTKGIYTVQYNDLSVALVEMQVRNKDKHGKFHYAKPIMKVIILSENPIEALEEKQKILKDFEVKRRRMAFKILYAIISSGFLAVQAFSHLSWI